MFRELGLVSWILMLIYIKIPRAGVAVIGHWLAVVRARAVRAAAPEAVVQVLVHEVGPLVVEQVDGRLLAVRLAWHIEERKQTIEISKMTKG